MCLESSISVIALLKCIQNTKINVLLFLEMKLDNVVLVFLHVLLYQPHSPREHKVPFS